MKFFKIDETMHLTKICPDCLKKYRKCAVNNQSIESCRSEFPGLDQMSSICETSCSRLFFRNGKISLMKLQLCLVETYISSHFKVGSLGQLSLKVYTLNFKIFMT